jgi:hypothetical protein
MLKAQMTPTSVPVAQVLVGGQVGVGVAGDAGQRLGCLHGIGEGTKHGESSLTMVSNVNLVTVGQLENGSIPLE